jgi:hypothetical protein
MSTQLAEGQDIMSFANTASDTKNRLSNPQIAGTTTTTGTDYNAGPINYTALPVKSTDFQDPMG